MESQKLKFNCLLIIWGDWNPNFYLNFCLIDIFYLVIECFISRIGIFEIGILMLQDWNPNVQHSVICDES